MKLHTMHQTHPETNLHLIYNILDSVYMTKQTNHTSCSSYMDMKHWTKRKYSQCPLLRDLESNLVSANENNNNLTSEL